MVNLHLDVPANLTQEARRYVPATVHRDGRSSAIGVAELNVRAALSHLDEAQPLELGNNLAWFEYGNGAHTRQLSDANRFGADEFRFR